MICNDCQHRDMCKYKNMMENSIGTMMDSRPHMDDFDFTAKYFKVSFNCNKYLQENKIPKGFNIGNNIIMPC